MGVHLIHQSPSQLDGGACVVRRAKASSLARRLAWLLATHSGGGGQELKGGGQERDMDRLPQTPWQHIIEGVDRILVCLFQKSVEKRIILNMFFVATHSPGKDP
jgi:hypothetical protein